MEELRKHFPALQSCTYLNTASNGVIPKPVVEWRREHDLNLMNHASVFRDKHKIHIEEIRKTVSSFFGASANETALIPNFSFGINTVLEGLPKKQKILLLKNDYPSINWPVETRDFEVCYAEIDENLERNIEQLELTINFDEWETIHTEISQKYDDKTVNWLAEKSGLKIETSFSDKKGFYKNYAFMKA